MYQIRNRETGTVIDEFQTLEDAAIELLKYEQIDTDAGCYEPNFYEIFNTETEEVEHEY